MRTYYALDLETGGLDPNKNAIVSLAFIALNEKLEEVESYYTLVKDNPEKIIEDKALEINGLNRRLIFEEGRPIDQIIVKLKPIFENTIMIFHNAAFDAKFLNVNGMNIEKAIDTMNLSKRKWPTEKAKLGSVIQRFGLEIKDAHDALGDSKMTVQALREFVKDDKLDALTPRPIDFYRWKRK